MKLLLIFLLQLVHSCNLPEAQDQAENEPLFDTAVVMPLPDTLAHLDTAILDTAKIKTGSLTRTELLAFARKQIGTHYCYASTDPKKGFDCSGFITYVFNHFNVSVPRSSVDFTHVGQPVSLEEARPGDLILFTGTNNRIRTVGHMGIVESIDSSEIHFIHSSSGKANGVTITPLNDYYQGRFMSIRRIFPEQPLTKKLNDPVSVKSHGNHVHKIVSGTSFPVRRITGKK